MNIVLCLISAVAFITQAQADYMCTRKGGICQAISKTCPCGPYEIGLCNGPSNVRCCLKNADNACCTGGGKCQTDNRSCAGGYQSGLCYGVASRKCCLSAADKACTAKKGKCQKDSLACAGEYQSGLCSGAASRRCCVSSKSSSGTLSHSQALSLLRSNGIGISSSGGCSNKYNPTCTSLEGIRSTTINGLIAFKRACKCPTFIVTGGTETGHSGGTYSHGNGYKIDIGLQTCITSYIMKRFTYSGVRSGDRARLYKDGNNVYALESNHWDILYR